MSRDQDPESSGDTDVTSRPGTRCSAKIQDVWLRCDELSEISKCQDGMPFFIFFVYRFLVAGYFIAFFIYLLLDTIRAGQGGKYFIYLTNWTYIVVTLYLIVAFVNVVLDLVHRRRIDRSAKRQRKPGSIRFQVQWLLFNIAITISIVITVAYWAILRPMLDDAHDGEKTPLVVDLSIHTFPAVFALLDLLVTKIVVRFVHVIYPFAFMFVYGIFAVIYWGAGGTDPYGNPYIYPVLDFGNDPGIATAAIFGCLVGMVLSHGFVTLLHSLRVRYLDPSRPPEPEEVGLRRDSYTETDPLLS